MQGCDTLTLVKQCSTSRYMYVYSASRASLKLAADLRFTAESRRAFPSLAVRGKYEMRWYSLVEFCRF